MAIETRREFAPAQEQPMQRNEVGQPTFTLTIDGKVVRAYEGQTLLSVATENGIHDIPTLCDDEKLEPTSACR
ncbi:MAG TPA: 2Fe-2S iron-sulfur cluster-binding protein, partial [Ktedonobacterales bacterium]